MAFAEHARKLVASARRVVGNGIGRAGREAQVKRLQWEIDRQKAGLGEAAYALLRNGQLQTDHPDVRRHMSRIGELVQRLEQLQTRSRRGALGHRDAGWVQVFDVQDGRARGRGRLLLRRIGARPDQPARFEGRIESFVPADEPALADGDHVSLLMETSSEQYPVTVQAIEAEGSVVTVLWTGEELPATLRELGGS
jgi:hypothetical protein